MGQRTSRSRTVKTTKTVFRVVELLNQLEGATLPELNEQLDLAKSTIYEHLVTLQELGYVTQDSEGYRLTLRFLDHGIHVKNQWELSGFIGPALKQLAEETGEIAWVVVEEQGRSYILEVAEGDQAVHTVERIGRRAYLHENAAGKAILAFLAPERVDEIIEEHGLPQETAETITDREELEEEFEEIREHECAFMDSEAVRGLRGVAAPIIVRDRILGAISVAGPAKRLSGSRFRSELPDKVQAAANTIELEVAYT